MKTKGILAGVALSAALMFGLTIPAFAAEIPTVNKTLQVNEGSDVSATFSYTATPVALTTSTEGETTYIDGPAVAIENISVTAEGEEATGTGAITFGGKADASAFPHAGIYAWKIVEVQNGYEGTGTMQYDPQVYTLIVTVENGDNGLQLGPIVVAKGEATSTDNSSKVSGGDFKFVNKYTETTTENNTDLKITKVTSGTQADLTKKFDFTVTFDASALNVLPADMDAAQVLDAITWTADGATDISASPASGTTRVITFKAANADAITFSNVLVGVKYTVSEASAAGYTPTYAAVADGTASQSTDNLVIGDEENTGTMTNTYTPTTPTGLMLDNLPFILLGLVAIAGIAVYGAAKRKLER